MSLSPEVVRGLESELHRLEAERKELEATIASIRQLLGQAAVNPPVPTDTSVEVPSGFREGIRAVLRDAGGPLTPKEVALEIKARKYPGWDSESLNARVNNDLWKMKEANQLAKSQDGYTLAGGGGRAHQ